MRAFRVHELGAPPRLDLDAPVPDPGPGEVLLRVRACGVNFADTLMAIGKYQEKPPLPFAPGLEIAGVVERTVPGGPALGARVAALVGHGGMAEYATAPAAACAEIPEGLSDEAAAGFMVAYGTSDLALRRRARLAEGETLLVLGAAGGVGLTAVELGKLMGARVIAAARGAEKLSVARAAGADHLIDTDEGDLREQVLGLGGADVVYDPIGGDQFRAAMRATRPEGRLLPLGFASGDVPQIPANILMVKNLTAIGVYWGGYMKFQPDALSDSVSQLFQWWAEGRLKPHVSHIMPLNDAEAALALLRDRKSTGKVVIRPN